MKKSNETTRERNSSETTTQKQRFDKKPIRVMQLNFDPEYKGSTGERTLGKSKTLPDLNIPIREMLIKHTRGIPLNAEVRQAGYFNTLINEFDDNVDRIHYLKSLIDKQKALNAKVKQEREAAQKAREEAERDAERVQTKVNERTDAVIEGTTDEQIVKQVEGDD